MLTIALAALLATVAIVGFASLTDSVLKWRNAYSSIQADLQYSKRVGVPANDSAIVTLKPNGQAATELKRPLAQATLAIAA